MKRLLVWIVTNTQVTCCRSIRSCRVVFCLSFPCLGHTFKECQSNPSSCPFVFHGYNTSYTNNNPLQIPCFLDLDDKCFSFVISFRGHFSDMYLRQYFRLNSEWSVFSVSFTAPVYWAPYCTTSYCFPFPNSTRTQTLHLHLTPLLSSLHSWLNRTLKWILKH